MSGQCWFDHEWASQILLQQVGDDALVHLAHHWRLITLDLSNCVLLSNDGLQHVKGMPLP